MTDRIDASHRRPATAPRERARRRDHSLATAIIGNANGPVLIFKRLLSAVRPQSRRAEIPSAPTEQATPTPAGEPTSSAKLEIKTAQIIGSASAKVPPDDARHMMTTFGIMGCLFIGIGSTVLTLQISAALTGPALAELLVTLVAVVVIAVSSRIRP